jgi:hypothetical protein
VAAAAAERPLPSSPPPRGRWPVRLPACPACPGSGAGSCRAPR